MKKHFANYNQSLALKELGFDESCLGVYVEGSKQLIINNTTRNWNDQLKNGNTTSAPLKSQVFDWFREKYNLVFNFISYNIVKPAEYYWSITWDDEAKASGIVKSYEEAESACIDKLIEILQNDK